MNIVVCVKQVPEIALVNVDANAGTLNLPQSPGMINPFDAYAIEEALRWREKLTGTVWVLSLGGKEADYALREGLALGADEAVHLMDEKFADLDTTGAALVLAAGIKKIGSADLVIFGKQAIDYDSSSVGAAVGGVLNWPAVMYVRKVESLGDGKIVIERMTDDGFDKVTAPTPAVISVVKEINEPRLPSLKGKMNAKKKAVAVYSAADLGVDMSAPAMTSASKTIKAANPPARPKGEMISGATPQEIADKLFAKLRESQVL